MFKEYKLKETKWYYVLIISNIIFSIILMNIVKNPSLIDNIGLITQVLLVFMFVIKKPRIGAMFALVSSSIFTYQMLYSSTPGTNLLAIKGIYFSIFNTYQIYLTTKKSYMDNFLEHSAQKNEIIFSIIFGVLGITFYLFLKDFTFTLIFVLALGTYSLGFVAQIFETFGSNNQFIVWTITDFIGFMYALASNDKSSMIRYGVFVLLQIQAIILIRYEINKNSIIGK